MGNKKTKKKVLVLKSGERIPVVGEKGKYWLCRGAQFRKSNPMIERIDLELPEIKRIESAVDAE